MNELSHRRAIVSGGKTPQRTGTRHETAIDASVTLKRDALGTVGLVHVDHAPRIVRDTATASRGLGWLARRLARNERAALEHAAGIPGIPVLHGADSTRLTREYLPGAAMHLEPFAARAFFRAASRLLRRLHRRGIAHNDLAKEANWICMPGGRAGIVDFQLALISRHRSRLFRTLAREDLRHLLKHKRHYAPQLLTMRERQILARPSGLARTWRYLFKPLYHVVTRRILGWPERADARERQWHPGELQ